MATTSFFVTTPDYNFVLFVRYKVYKRSLLSSQLCGRFVGKGEFWLMKIVETKWEKKTCHKDVLPLFLSFSATSSPPYSRHFGLEVSYWTQFYWFLLILLFKIKKSCLTRSILVIGDWRLWRKTSEMRAFRLERPLPGMVILWSFFIYHFVDQM